MFSRFIVVYLRANRTAPGLRLLRLGPARPHLSNPRAEPAVSGAALGGQVGCSLAGAVSDGRLLCTEGKYLAYMWTSASSAWPLHPCARSHVFCRFVLTSAYVKPSEGRSRPPPIKTNKKKPTSHPPVEPKPTAAASERKLACAAHFMRCRNAQRHFLVQHRLAQAPVLLWRHGNHTKWQQEADPRLRLEAVLGQPIR